jgi:uncharacterized protein (TIGR02246 family)
MRWFKCELFGALHTGTTQTVTSIYLLRLTPDRRLVEALMHSKPSLTRSTMLACASMSAVIFHLADAVAQASMTCAPVTPQEIVALFDRWNASLATRDADKVTSNYAPDAVLLATVSNRPRTDSAGIKDYFEHFLERRPQGSIDTRTIRVGCNTASDVGTYTFNLSGKTPGTMETVRARYSFIYELRDGKWLIVHHHSSAMPEPAQ